ARPPRREPSPAAADRTPQWLAPARPGGAAAPPAGCAAGTERPGQPAEAQPRRDRYARPECYRLARAERGQEPKQAVAGIGDGGAHDALIVLVCHPHGEHGAALGNERRIELRGALRHETEEHTVFASLLGDTGERFARRPKADRAVGVGVVVRLLAHDQKRQRAVAPQAELESKPEH